jgi:hypothetical protein
MCTIVAVRGYLSTTILSIASKSIETRYPFFAVKG